MPDPDPRPAVSRRRLLQSVAVATGLGGLPAVGGATRTETDGFAVLLQGDRCVELSPLAGEQPVEDLYDYTYPMDEFEGPPGSSGETFSSEGTTDLQRDRTSTLFLYDGPEGLSLVIVHGRVGGAEDAGGTVTFTIRGLDDDGTWIVRDDYYLKDGEQADSNFDRWRASDGTHTVDWAYFPGRTDGGAYRGLGLLFDVEIEPAFNDAAALADEHDFGPIESWVALSGDLDDPDRHDLALAEPVTIRTGLCLGDDEGEDEDEGNDRGNAGDDEDEDREEEKEERKEEREEEKEERKEEREEEKEEREEEKEERKEEKEERKQEREEEKEERKEEREEEKQERKEEREEEKEAREEEKKERKEEREEEREERREERREEQEERDEDREEAEDEGEGGGDGDDD